VSENLYAAKLTFAEFPRWEITVQENRLRSGSTKSEKLPGTPIQPSIVKVAPCGLNSLTLHGTVVV